MILSKCLDVWGMGPVLFQKSRSFLYTASQNNKTSYTGPQLPQILTDFQSSFTVTRNRKFAIKMSLKIPPNLKCVTTLSCEILISENTLCSIWLALFFWYKKPDIWQAVTIVTEASHSNNFHQLWLPDRRMSHWCSPILTCHLSPSLCAKTAFCSDVFLLCCCRCVQSVRLWIFQCS